MIMHDADYSKVSRQALFDKLEHHGLLDETRKRAYTYADLSLKNLEILPKTEYRLALEEIPGYMIERNK